MTFDDSFSQAAIGLSSPFSLAAAFLISPLLCDVLYRHGSPLKISNIYQKLLIEENNMESSSVVKRLPMPFAESIGESDLVSEKKHKSIRYRETQQFSVQGMDYVNLTNVVLYIRAARFCS